MSKRNNLWLPAVIREARARLREWPRWLWPGNPHLPKKARSDGEGDAK